MKNVRKQAGFTILELMIATMVFSVILLIVTYGIIQIGNRYYKATLQSQTQAAARNAIDEVSRNIQFSGEGQVLLPATTGGGIGAYCSNGIQYAYILSKMQDSSGANGLPKHVLVALPDPGGCTLPAQALFDSPNLPPGDRDLLANRMRIANFTVKQDATRPDIFSVTIHVTTGEDDLLCSPSSNDCNNDAVSSNLNNPDLNCKAKVGTTYCAMSELSTVITRRLVQ